MHPVNGGAWKPWWMLICNYGFLQLFLQGCDWGAYWDVFEFLNISKARYINTFFIIGGKMIIFYFVPGLKEDSANCSLKGADSPAFREVSGLLSVFCLPVSIPTTLALPTGRHKVRADVRDVRDELSVSHSDQSPAHPHVHSRNP